ncbi:hypothetical protein PMZ80_010591 [Knufia obscura]|uniref:non-specific serine/threonine protein kinase n=1 Tax=Knufia obscura TaxID=1635080 RepID=A0ABR0R8U1_9EURO|nr:hypothetical protein PMZ80_010591 [Knufia obscura]
MDFQFCPGSNEDLEKYEVGGFHPVNLGDTFKNGRYVVIQKLGFGGFSTVWLARDLQQSRYVALKLTTAQSAKDLREIDFQRCLLRSSSSDLQISEILDQFTFTGPNGRHICLVFEVYGPDLSMLADRLHKVRPDIGREISGQITTSLAYMHRQDVAFGDLSTHNILLGLEDLTNWSVEKLYQALGEPKSEEVTTNGTTPPIGAFEHAPRGTYSPIEWDNVDLVLLNPKVVLTDLNEAVYVGGPTELKDEIARNGGVNHNFMAPEYAFNITSQHSKASDVWALGCIFYELRTSKSLFGNSSKSIHTAMQELLGELPAEWKCAISSGSTSHGHQILEGGDIQRESIEQKLDEVGMWLPWVTVSAEERKQLIIEAEGEEALEQEDNAMVKDIDRPLTQPPARLSDEELADLKDLLSKMLCYRPEERITMEEVLEHPWLNRTYEDHDSASPWMAQFHWGWDPKPPTQIFAADFDMDDIDVDCLDLDDDADDESDEYEDDASEDSSPREEDVLVREDTACDVDNLQYPERFVTHSVDEVRPEVHYYTQVWMSEVWETGRVLVGRLLEACGTMARLVVCHLRVLLPGKEPSFRSEV